MKRISKYEQLIALPISLQRHIGGIRYIAYCKDYSLAWECITIKAHLQLEIDNDVLDKAEIFEPPLALTDDVFDGINQWYRDQYRGKKELRRIDFLNHIYGSNTCEVMEAARFNDGYEYQEIEYVNNAPILEGMFLVTKEWIEANMSPKGGFRFDQIRALGMDPKQQWKRKIIGELITLEQKADFERLVVKKKNFPSALG